MKPQNLVLIVVGSVLGFFAVAGTAVYLTWKMVPAQPPHRNPFVGRKVMPPMHVNMAELPAMEPAQMPDWNVNGFNAPVAHGKLKELRGPVAGVADFSISGPHTHDNLTVFLIHGPDTMKGKQVVTLHDALNRGQAVVHDTRTNTLMVENRSGSDLFIQSGDIVKGGTQDRTLQYDLLVPANSGQVPLQAFCVEVGRSFARGGEPVAIFGMATEQLPGKNLRLANLHMQSQEAVWEGVSRIQKDLEMSLGNPVQSAQSKTSLQLTLENQRLGQAVQNYLNDLSGILNGKKDVIGVVVAINGRIHSIDQYASADLFRNLWPKLLKAGAIEALAERNVPQADLPEIETVLAMLGDLDQAAGRQQTVNNRINMIRQENQQLARFDTCDQTQNNLVVHRCILVK
jgi:ARG and Rhodanese-Phosphatase-superfamily-associated Protein domain